MDNNIFKDSKKIIYVVGIGPGAHDQMTIKADRVLSSADLIVGYTAYVDMIRDIYPDKEFLETPMRGEAERCRMAFENASLGKRTALICGGDPGIYALAGLMLQIGEDYTDIKTEIVPGVTAATAGAALLGAPLSNDMALISLSDYLTPKETIEKRLKAASASDLVICLYNPGSAHRPDMLKFAADIVLLYRKPSCVCGIARKIGREGESVRICALSDLPGLKADMQTTVFIGNSETYTAGGKMVTPRGYDI